MKKINSHFTIASPQEMIDAKLFECTPTDEIVLWCYNDWRGDKKPHYAPMLTLNTEKQPGDEFKYEDYYFSLPKAEGGHYMFLDFMIKRGFNPEFKKSKNLNY